jgi:hypothetical protein
LFCLSLHMLSFNGIDGTGFLQIFCMLTGASSKYIISSGGKDDRDANLWVYVRLALNWSKSFMVIDFQSLSTNGVNLFMEMDIVNEGFDETILTYFKLLEFLTARLFGSGT